MRHEPDPDRLTSIIQGEILEIEGEEPYDDRDELHIIPRDYGLSLSLWDYSYRGYNPEAGIVIDWDNLDAVIAGLEEAKKHRPDTVMCPACLGDGPGSSCEPCGGTGRVHVGS